MEFARKELLLSFGQRKWPNFQDSKGRLVTSLISCLVGLVLEELYEDLLVWNTDYFVVINNTRIWCLSLLLV